MVCRNPWEFPDVRRVCGGQIERVWLRVVLGCSSATVLSACFITRRRFFVFVNAGFISAYGDAETPAQSEEEERSTRPLFYELWLL